MESTVLNLFSTPVKIISLPNKKEVSEIVGKCVHYGFEQNFWENLEEDEAIKIQKVFTDEAELYLKEITNRKIDLKISRSWTNLTEKYAFIHPHAHYTNIVVAVYYIRTFEDSGDLLLHDPIGGMNYIEQNKPQTSHQQYINGKCYFRFKPKAGDLIIFPGYVVHSVEPNMADETRISLAVNFKYKDFKQFKLGK
jgi:hypothetical protein